MKYYLQQGDVLIIPCSIPTDTNKIKTNVLQEGEHTGHAHRLFDGNFEVYETKEKVKYLKVVTPVNLRHEEHKAFQIDPGEYQIGIIKEYDPFEQEMRNVLD